MIDKENMDIISAMHDWMDSQNIHKTTRAIIFATAAGIEVARVAGNNTEHISKGTNILCNIVLEYAMTYAR